MRWKVLSSDSSSALPHGTGYFLHKLNAPSPTDARQKEREKQLINSVTGYHSRRLKPTYREVLTRNMHKRWGSFGTDQFSSKALRPRVRERAPRMGQPALESKTARNASKVHDYGSACLPHPPPRPGQWVATDDDVVKVLGNEAGPLGPSVATASARTFSTCRKPFDGFVGEFLTPRSWVNDDATHAVSGVRNDDARKWARALST